MSGIWIGYLCPKADPDFKCFSNSKTGKKILVFNGPLSQTVLYVKENIFLYETVLLAENLGSSFRMANKMADHTITGHKYVRFSNESSI
jgi:hypothetical protein